MNGLLVKDQTSGNEWGSPPSARVYYRAQSVPEEQKQRMQLAEFADLEAQMNHFEEQHEKLIAEIRREYVIPSDASVLDFLRRHRQIAQVLVEALPHLRRFFANTVFSLRTKADESGWQMLYVSAIWPEEPGAALAALDRFDDAWWIANSYPSGNSITFTYKLV
jgi:hypothetical protein